MHSSDDARLQGRLGPLLKRRTQERIGQSDSALELATRVLTCCSLDLNCDVDRRALLELQCEDGSWEPGCLYTYGSTGVELGNRGVATALAINAIAISEHPPEYY